jgi:hypothetical protein
MLRNNRFWTIALMLVYGASYAQLGTSSPYSYAGLGELKLGGFTQHTAMGGTSIGQQSTSNFSPNNPASYANLRFTVYDVGAYASSGKLTTNTKSAQTSTGDFSHFAMAFPFETKRKMAVAFGLLQYSDVGYEIKNRVNADTPSYYNLLRGNGGINKLFVGYGISPIKGLNVGVNANYNFGSIQSAYIKVYPNTDNTFSLTKENFFAYRGLDFDLGLQYSVYDSVRLFKASSPKMKHTFAASLHTPSDLKGNGYYFSSTFFGSAYENGRTVIIDTIAFLDDIKDVAQKPLGFTVGYTMSMGDKWALSGEVEKYLWSAIKDKTTQKNYLDNTRYSVGVSVIPSPKYEEQGNFFGKVRYSAGARYQNLYYNFGSTTISEIGISFGLGLPVVKYVRIDEEKVPLVSRVNLTAEYIKRGTTTNGLIQEDYFNIGIGLNLADKWFTQRKYH